MTTETAPDPVIQDWSNDLEDELAEAGMEPPQAKAYARAFELGMTRVLSVVATKQELLGTEQGLRGEIAAFRQELKDEIAASRQEFKDEIAALRQEFKDEIAALRQEFKDEIAALRRDMQREIDRLERLLLLFGGAAIGLLVTLVVRSFS